MPAPDHARLTIDFDLRDGPMSGVVRDGRGHEEPFDGWMALTRTIERALDTARSSGEYGGHPGRVIDTGKDPHAEEE